MAKGGVATETVSSNRQHQKGVHQSISKGDAGTSTAGAYVAGHGYGNNPEKAKSLHREKLAEMKAMPKPKMMAEGGDVVSGVMRKRYSKGGEVANDVGVAEADESPAEYDDLVLRDDLDGSQPVDSNEHGDADVSDDPVDRIMLKKKKDKLPRPA